MKRASNGTPSSQPVTKKRPSTSILPSANEQLLLQQTSLLTRDNLSQLQISGLLSEVSCQSVYQNNNTAQWIDQFSHVLKDNMSQSIKVTPKNKWYSTVGLTKDIVDNLIKQNEKPLQIQAPAKLKMIGSHDLQCGTSPYVNIDLCISMPDSFFDHR